MRRRRTTKARSGPLTLDEVILWGCTDRAGLIEVFGTLAEAREAWRARRGLMVTNEGTEPEAFWALDGPAHLVKDTAPPPAPPPASHEEADRAREAFEAKRSKWLEAHGGDWRAITATANGAAR